PEALALPVGEQRQVDAGVLVHRIVFLRTLDESDAFATGFDHEAGLRVVRIQSVPDRSRWIAPPSSDVGIGEDPIQGRFIAWFHGTQPHTRAGQHFLDHRRAIMSARITAVALRVPSTMTPDCMRGRMSSMRKM